MQVLGKVRPAPTCPPPFPQPAAGTLLCMPATACYICLLLPATACSPPHMPWSAAGPPLHCLLLPAPAPHYPCPPQADQLLAPHFTEDLDRLHQHTGKRLLDQAEGRGQGRATEPEAMQHEDANAAGGAGAQPKAHPIRQTVLVSATLTKVNALDFFQMNNN